MQKCFLVTNVKSNLFDKFIDKETGASDEELKQTVDSDHDDSSDLEVPRERKSTKNQPKGEKSKRNERFFSTKKTTHLDDRLERTQINSFKNRFFTIKKNLGMIHLSIPIEQDFFLGVRNNAQRTKD